MKNTTIQKQKTLALALLDWHGGQSSPLYAVGSCMLSDADKGILYDPQKHRGHAPDEKNDDCGALDAAISELKLMKVKANYPETVTPAMERECAKLAKQLSAFLAPTHD